MVFKKHRKRPTWRKRRTWKKIHFKTRKRRGGVSFIKYGK